MSRRSCTRCKKAILRGKDQSVTCVVCPNLFHFECIESSELVSACSVQCCSRPLPTPPVTTPPPTRSGIKRPASPSSPPSTQLSKQHRLDTPLAPPSPSSIGSPELTDIMAGIPDYFTAFLAEFRTKNANIEASFERQRRSEEETKQELKQELRKEISGLEAKMVQANEERRRENAAIQGNLSALSQSMVSQDKCEVKISGIPLSPALTNEHSAQALLKVLEIPGYLAHVIELRDWSPRTPAGSQDGVPPERTPDDANYREMVMQFASPVVRDSVMSRSGRLKDKTAQTIFGLGGDRKVYLNYLFPPEVYRIFKSALVKSRDLNYLRPVVRNNVVCMRPTIREPLIPIHALNTLDSLQPRPKRL